MPLTSTSDYGPQAEGTVLEQMLRVLADRGWTQEEMVSSNGQVCAEGACRIASGLSGIVSGGYYWTCRDPKRETAFIAAAKLLAAAAVHLFPGRVPIAYKGSLNPWSAVVSFNDHPDTTLEDVQLVIKHAISAQESIQHVLTTQEG